MSVWVELSSIIVFVGLVGLKHVTIALNEGYDEFIH